MSDTQRESVSYWTGVIVKIMIGISGGVLLMLYSTIKNEAQQTREEFRNSIQRIEVNTTETSKSVDLIESKVNLIEYRLNKLDE